MDKIDFRKNLKGLYGPTTTMGIHLVDVPPMQFLMIDGSGDPNTAASYPLAVETLYGVAYPLKFASKNQLGRDYVVPPLEGLWWAEDMAVFTARDKRAWSWTMMVMVPEWVERRLVEETIATVRMKSASPALGKLRFEVFDEGRAIQVLHTGSYDDEAPIIAKMHEDAVEAHGLSLSGKHHEIYLSDPRRTAPAKLKTILRQPVNEDR